MVGFQYGKLRRGGTIIYENTDQQSFLMKRFGALAPSIASTLRDLLNDAHSDMAAAQERAEMPQKSVYGAISAKVRNNALSYFGAIAGLTMTTRSFDGQNFPILNRNLILLAGAQEVAGGLRIHDSFRSARLLAMNRADSQPVFLNGLDVDHEPSLETALQPEDFDEVLLVTYLRDYDAGITQIKMGTANLSRKGHVSWIMAEKIALKDTSAPVKLVDLVADPRDAFDAGDIPVPSLGLRAFPIEGNDIEPPDSDPLFDIDADTGTNES